MNNTLEVRWFLEGRPSTEVTDWIVSLGAEAESARTDLYLVSEDPAMNVKLREGNVQTKHRIGDRTPISFAEDVRGIQERWVKWSFPTVEQHHDLFDEDPTGLWVPVHKERLRLKLTPEEQTSLVSRMIEPDPADAKIELTEVRSKVQEGWTICMEAEGRPEALPGTLQQTGTLLFGKGSPPSLSTNHSYGYARWINALEKSGKPITSKVET